MWSRDLSEACNVRSAVTQSPEPRKTVSKLADVSSGLGACSTLPPGLSAHLSVLYNQGRKFLEIIPKRFKSSARAFCQPHWLPSPAANSATPVAPREQLCTTRFRAAITPAGCWGFPVGLLMRGSECHLGRLITEPPWLSATLNPFGPLWMGVADACRPRLPSEAAFLCQESAPCRPSGSVMCVGNADTTARLLRWPVLSVIPCVT